MTLNDNNVTFIDLHKAQDGPTGKLCAAEVPQHVPFDVKRVFYIYDVPMDTMRGHHAHRTQTQMLICLNGSLRLETTYQGGRTKEFMLSQPDQAVLLPPMTWLNFQFTQSNTICLVLASGAYDERDYIRRYDEYNALVSNAELT